MATDTPNTLSRDLFPGAAISSVPRPVPALASGSDLSTWSRAAALELQTRHAYKAYDDDVLKPATLRFHAGDMTGFRAIETGYGKCISEHHAAYSALLCLPAPTCAAFASKLDLMVAQSAHEDGGAGAYIATLRDDAARFMQGAA